MAENRPDPKTDANEPSSNRQDELRAAYDANVRQGRSPYYGASIQTRGELLWIAKERQWNIIQTETPSAEAPQTDMLKVVNLSSADLRGRDLTRLRFVGANLSGADLSDTDLTGANLRGANLCGASLLWAKLQSADLSDSEMDSRTNLKRITLDSKTLLGDIRWNGVPVTRVDWSSVPRLGDELDIYTADTRRQRILACRYAARAYRGLAILLRSQGLLVPASRYRLREQQLERLALRAEGKVLPYLGSLILDFVAGYGERPGRIFTAYLIVISAFATIYWEAANFFTGDAYQLKWYEALVLSLSSFHGRGFFPQMISLGDPLAIIAAIEAVIGLFIELMLIATFSRRFLGNY